jgi:hypothetical protein
MSFKEWYFGHIIGLQIDSAVQKNNDYFWATHV